MTFRWTTQENHLSEYAHDIRQAAADILGKGILDIHAATVAGSPVDTGQLKGGWQPIMPDTTSPNLVGGVGTNVEHATYVELGTGRTGNSSSYPFVRQARYTMTWPGMAARAMLGNAGAMILPKVQAALGALQQRLHQR